MSDAQFSFNRPYKPFGMNIKVPEIGEKTLKQAGETLSNIATGPVDPLFKFLEENETVFNGDISYKINKMFAESFTIGSAMRVEDEKTNAKSTMLLCGIGTDKNKIKALKKALQTL